MKKIIVFLVTAVLCFAFTTDVQKRVIRSNGFDIECYISLKKIKNFDANKTYYWFKSGRVHQSAANVGGNILHESYSKFYRSNQIAEQGTFNYGLKTGVWQDWNENGQLKSKITWNNGHKEGVCITYDNQGKIAVIGDYKNNLKVGKWINYKTKDTTYHKNDLIFNEKPKGFIERALTKKDSLEKVQIKLDRITKRRTDSINRVKIKLKRVLERKNDSIERSQKKLNRKIKKKQDSINRINKEKHTSAPTAKKKNTNQGFFKQLFKKKK